MYLQRIFTKGLAINSYIIGDMESKRAIVIDPTRQVVPYIVNAQEEGLNITDIIETHVHADFVSGSTELKHQLNEKPIIHCSAMGGDEWIPRYADNKIRDGDQVMIGKVCLKAIHTPGHTPEHLCWICYDHNRSLEVPWCIFSGDCLFVGSIGRPDLLGNAESIPLAKRLYHSLFKTLAALPDFVEILPGHGSGSLCGKNLGGTESSTMGYERQNNPYLKQTEEEEWIPNALHGLSPVPRYFKKMKRINVQGPSLLSSLRYHPFDPLQQKREELFLVDIRLPEAFAQSHYAGALNIPFSHSFQHWAGHFLPDEQPIGIVTENMHIIPEVINTLHMIGVDQDISVIVFDPDEKGEVVSCPMLEPHHLKEEMGGRSFLMIDVRTDDEWESKHLPEAIHLELDRLENHLLELDPTAHTVLVCRSGMRSSIAASLLRKAGFISVFSLRGGMQGL